MAECIICNLKTKLVVAMNNITDNELSAIKNLNIDIGLKVCNEDMSLYKRMLGKFYHGYHDFPEKFKAALNQEDEDLAFRMLHNLKGVAASMGANHIKEIAVKLELARKEEKINTDSIQKYLASLELELNELMDSLQLLKTS
jgi:HPt (histidine-containing phosphotransfer) domain-containing protein